MGENGTLSYRTFLGSFIFASTILAPNAMGQTASPDLVPISTSIGVDSKSADLKMGLPARNTETSFLGASPKTAAHFSNNRFLVLSAAVYAAALADMHQTVEVRNLSWWYETDPLARPFARLPSPAYYATGLALATGLNWVSWKMGHSRHSRRWRKLSAVPQLLAITGNTYGFKSNRY
jgi:hypothetical protein